MIHSSHLKLQHFLMSSWMYYIHDENVISDTEYDHLSKDLLEDWEHWQVHQHAFLVKKDDLLAGSLFSAHRSEYPNLVKAGAIRWWEATHDSTWEHPIHWCFDGVEKYDLHPSNKWRRDNAKKE